MSIRDCNRVLLEDDPMWKVFRRPFLHSLVLSVVICTCVGTAVIADEETTSEGKTISINGMDMYYEDHGDGETLVLLHGFSRSGAIWKPFITEFSKHYRLIVPDLRGHGRSTNPTSRLPCGSRHKMSLHSWTHFTSTAFEPLASALAA